MSEFHVTVVEIGQIERHPNADTLGITNIWDYPVIVKLNDFQPGDRAVYVPVDAIVPDTPEWTFLQGHRRIKARKIRGIYSQGLLVHADLSWPLGDDVREKMSIIKWEPELRPSMRGEDESDPGCMPIYTDIEGLRRWPNVLAVGENVILTEKIHGANGRWVFWKDRLWVGSHKRVKREGDTIWWRVAQEYRLAEKLALYPGIVLYGEVYGRVQDLRYGTGSGELRLALFDAFDMTKGYYDIDAFYTLTSMLDLPTVPKLYRGPWSSELKSFAEGKTTMGADHVREGFVIRPVRERWDQKLGRVILKMIGEGYLLRKDA